MAIPQESKEKVNLWKINEEDSQLLGKRDAREGVERTTKGPGGCTIRLLRGCTDPVSGTGAIPGGR